MTDFSPRDFSPKNFGGISSSGFSVSARSSGRLPSIVRPFAHPPAVSRVLDRIEKRRAIDGEDTQASLCIGGPSNFQHTSGETSQPTQPSVSWPPREVDEELPAGIPEYQEIDKKVQVVRVVNPEDEDMWVDDERRIWSLLQRDNGTQFKIRWDND